MSNERSRAWSFTLNNHSVVEECEIKAAIDSARYGIYGREVGESGTPHLQGYIVFQHAKSFAAAKRLLGGRVHLEKSRGNAEHNRNYCAKDGDFYEHGEIPLSGKRKGEAERERWDNALAACKDGRFEDVPADILIRYYGSCKRIRADFQPSPQDQDGVTGIWFVGPPGTGKSHTARAEFPDAYIKNQNKWWCGYNSEDYVIIDDFDSAMLGHHLKIWADRYAFTAEFKGGSKKIRPKKIIVTSNYQISEIFSNDRVLCSAIERRFVVREFNEVYVP